MKTDSKSKKAWQAEGETTEGRAIRHFIFRNQDKLHQNTDQPKSVQKRAARP